MGLLEDLREAQNPTYKKVPKIPLGKHSKPCIFRGLKFVSLVDAAKHFNLGTSTVHAHINGRWNNGKWLKPKEDCYLITPEEYLKKD